MAHATTIVIVTSDDAQTSNMSNTNPSLITNNTHSNQLQKYQTSMTSHHLQKLSATKTVTKPGNLITN